MGEQIAKYNEQCLRLPKDLKEWNAYKKLKQEIEDLKEILPIIEQLRKPSIRDRHW
jgi:dynein heavy chain